MGKPVIGFIGVGLMGAGMAKNIVTKGYPLVIIGHKNREQVERLKALGAVETNSARELAAQCDIVHLCVTGSPQVEVLMDWLRSIAQTIASALGGPLAGMTLECEHTS